MGWDHVCVCLLAGQQQYNAQRMALLMLRGRILRYNAENLANLTESPTKTVPARAEQREVNPVLPAHRVAALSLQGTLRPTYAHSARVCKRGNEVAFGSN